MMLTSSIQKLWPFCQLVLPEFSIFSIETYRKKETAVILKCIDQLPQNLVRVHNLVGSFYRSHQNFKFYYSSYCFLCFLLFVYCLPFVPTLILHYRYKKFTDGKIGCQTINYNVLACYRSKQNQKITSATDFMAWFFL